MKEKYYIVLSFAWITLGLTSSLFAQQKANPQASRSLLANSDDPSLNEGLLSSLSGVSITAGEEGSLATFRISLGDPAKNGWSIALSSPIDKDRSFTNLADLNGLAGAFTATFSATRTFLPKLQKAELESVEKRINADCNRFNLSDAGCSLEKALTHIHTTGTHREQRNLAWQAIGEKPIFSLQAEVKIGRQTFNFLETQTASPTDNTEMPYSFSVAFGRTSGSNALSARLRYENRFVESSQLVNRCNSFRTDGMPEGTTLEQCIESPFGAPIEENRALLSLAGRFFFNKFAINPMVTYDSENDVTGVSLPIYFATNGVSDSNGKRQFTGGIRLGWVSDVASSSDQDFTASVFVSRALARKGL